MDLADKIRSYVSSWERRGYPDGIPDEAPVRLEELGKVPSYRVICIAIMKNDKNLESLGFRRTPCQIYMDLKRVELRSKGKAVCPQQLRLF